MECGLCMKRGPIGMFEMGIYVSVYGKERRYRPTVIYGDGVRRHRKSCREGGKLQRDHDV